MCTLEYPRKFGQTISPFKPSTDVSKLIQFVVFKFVNTVNPGEIITYTRVVYFFSRTVSVRAPLSAMPLSLERYARKPGIGKQLCSLFPNGKRARGTPCTRPRRLFLVCNTIYIYINMPTREIIYGPANGVQWRTCNNRTKNSRKPPGRRAVIKKNLSPSDTRHTAIAAFHI